MAVIPDWREQGKPLIDPFWTYRRLPGLFGGEKGKQATADPSLTTPEPTPKSKIAL